METNLAVTSTIAESNHFSLNSMLIPAQAVGSPAGQICIDMTGIEPAEYHKIRAFSQIFFYNSRGEFIQGLLSSAIPPVTAYSFHEEICSADLLAGDRVSPPPQESCRPRLPFALGRPSNSQQL